MPRFDTLKAMRTVLARVATATVLAALLALHATGVSAQGNSQLWSLVVHFEYQDGTQFDYVLAAGIPTSLMVAMLQECGQSHWSGSVVRYHCFPIPE